MHRRHGNGALAQLGERLLCKHQVIGSIPIGSTIPSIFPEMKRNGLPAKAGDMERIALLFDIVNGFFNRCRGDMVFGSARSSDRMETEAMIVHE